MSQPVMAIVNVSAPHYNLGAAKLSGWAREQGYVVHEFEGDPGLLLPRADVVALSVIFTWHAPIAREIAWRVNGTAEIWAGGPGLFRLQEWWQRETGTTCISGLDKRFERHPGTYRMTFAARGCPVGCHFCIVPKLEGKEFTLDWNFTPAPILCDNNISALPVEFQQFVIDRYRERGVRLLDANSGFEPTYFDEDCYQRWRQVLVGPWRFAFDITPEWRRVERMMRVLRSESPKKKQCYVLIGNEPIDACFERAQRVIEWGGEPYCQPEMPLDTLTKEPKVQHDWTPQLLRDFQRFFNRHLWRKLKLQEYMPRKYQPNPFAGMVMESESAHAR